MVGSWLSGWNPINSFPDYHGPYSVGTVDVELPASDLPAPSEAPLDAQPTIAFRIFYPCEKPEKSSQSRPVRWIPQPQRATIMAFMSFLGLKERTAGVLSYLPQQLYWIKLGAHRNAKLLEPPTSNGRWPVTVFSHGLAGSRNAYSFICGDMASNGMVVIALDHRDGSSPIQYVRETAKTEAHIVQPRKISHAPSNEVWIERDKQLRIRLWEASMAYEALMKIDAGRDIENLDSNTSRARKERVEMLWQFDGKLDIHRPGKVSWAGHSFGAVTITQLLKSIWYYPDRPSSAGRPLIVPRTDAAIVQQIMPESPTLLLDMWSMPLQSPDQAFLYDRPLPSYCDGGPNGDNVLSVLSEAFYKWENNRNIIKHAISSLSPSRRDSNAPQLSSEQDRLRPSWARLRDQSASGDSGYVSENSRRTSPERKAQTSTGPHMFYVQKSQHFNQSDFGVLFPWLARRFAKAEDPEQILELNTRAMVQVIREAGIEVAGEDDKNILDKTDTADRRWIPIPIANGTEVGAPNASALQAVNRKLSVTSSHGEAAPADTMTVGQNVQIQVES